MAATARLTPAQIAAHARARGLDPDAVLRVGSAEGLSGGIGDGGHAFGPFQLNDAGGVITGKFPGWSTQQKQEWAWSPAGVDYALGGIDKAAHGLHGADAVRAIVTKFERPADPQGEITRALGSKPMAAPAPTAAMSQPQPQVQPQRGGANPIAQALGLLGFKAPAGLGQAAPIPPPSAPPPLPTATTALQSPAAGHLAELLHEGVGGPTHSTGEHIHAASTNPQVMLALIAEAQRRGLSVRENPYTDPVDPVHAKNSFHNVTFPGMFNGKRLGEAVDVSGQGMSEYEKWVRARYQS